VQEMGVFQVRLGSYLLVTVPIYFQIIPPGPVFVENVGVHMRLPGCYGTIHKNVKDFMSTPVISFQGPSRVMGLCCHIDM